MNNLIIFLSIVSFISAETTTIYAVESAEYYAAGSGSSGCCTSTVLGSYNQNTLYTDWCQWWSQYNQCGSRSRRALWRFDLSGIPENANIINATFLAQGGGNWIQSFMSISDYPGPISLSMASHLANGGDWVLQGQGEIWSPVNQTIPNDNIISAYNEGQLSVMFHMYDASFVNTGINAPRIVIEYEIEIQECFAMSELECYSDSSCEWFEDIEYGDCSSYNNGTTCDANENCYWDLCYGGSYGSWSHCCRGGTYQVDNSYCDELSLIIGDVNGDGSVNVSDIVLMVTLILNSEYNEYSDMNEDGILNVLDIIELVNTILNP